MRDRVSEAAKKLAERLFSDDHARVRLYAESMIQRALDAAAAEAVKTDRETGKVEMVEAVHDACGVGATDMLRMIVGSLRAYPDGGGDIEVMAEVKRLIDTAKAEAYERAAVAAEKPSGHYQIGTNAVPYWNGVSIAAAIRALSPKPAEQPDLGPERSDD